MKIRIAGPAIACDCNEDRAQGFRENTPCFPVEQSFHAGRSAGAALPAGVTTARKAGAMDEDAPDPLQAGARP
jgi:hypothetical protein